MLQGKVLIAQGGGPTAVINQSLVGAVLEARGLASVAGVYGARHGVTGIVNEDFLDLGQESAENLERVAAAPGAALGSTRDKPDLAYCQEIFRVLRAHAIGAFFYIGGNDSADTVRIVADEAAKENYTLRAVHVPKTIDNDLMGNDHTPGYPSAARFVASAFAGVDRDNWALPGVYVGVVMGRHAGFLTAAAAAARSQPDDGPHLVYLPERVFDTDRFLDDVKSVYARLGRCVIAISEGVHDGEGVPIAAKLVAHVERDAHGNIQLSGTGALADSLTGHIRQRLAIKRVRADTFGYLQRAFLGCVSDVDRREAREAGRCALRFADARNANGTVTLRRTAPSGHGDTGTGGAYGAEFGFEDLELVAGKTRVMPDDFIAASGADVTAAFLDYLRPLLGSGLAYPARLAAPAVAKVLSV